MDRCEKCGKIYSINKVFASCITGKTYCKSDVTKCNKCQGYIGISERYLSKTSGKSYCRNHAVHCCKCGFYVGIDESFTSKISGRVYCQNDIVKCQNCGIYIGIDESTVCAATGKTYCQCTTFDRCLLCEQVYSSNSLKNGKCTACNTLSPINISDEILVVQKFDAAKGKTKNWLIGKNALNSVVIAKGTFSDTICVISRGNVVHRKTLSLMQKLRVK